MKLIVIFFLALITLSCHSMEDSHKEFIFQRLKESKDLSFRALKNNTLKNDFYSVGLYRTAVIALYSYPEKASEGFNLGKEFPCETLEELYALMRQLEEERVNYSDEDAFYIESQLIFIVNIVRSRELSCDLDDEIWFIDNKISDFKERADTLLKAE